MDGQPLIRGGNFASGIVPFLNNSVATFAQQIMVCYDHSLSVGVSKIWLFANFYLQAIQQPNLSFFFSFFQRHLEKQVAAGHPNIDGFEKPSYCLNTIDRQIYLNFGNLRCFRR